MPPGPRKRRRQRRAGSSPGFSVSADESHESDGTTSCPDTPEQGNRMLLSSMGTSSVDTFQTEEWLRVSDFDVGTPSSTTADSKGVDYDVATEEGSYGTDLRANHDKLLADWETASGDIVGAASSSTEDVAESMEAAEDNSVVGESVGSSQEQKLPVNKGNSECLSNKQDDHEKISLSSQSSSTKSDDLEKTSSCSETGSVGVEEDHGPASIEEFEQVNSENGSTEPAWQQEHENEKLTSGTGVHFEKLQDLEPCNIESLSVPEVQEEAADHHTTNSRQEDNTIISDPLEEDGSITGGDDAAISGMDGTSDQSIEAMDIAPLNLQGDTVKDMPDQEHDELNQLVDIAHSTELAHLAKQEENLLALEEEKNVSEPLANMLAPAQDSSETLQHSEGEDLKMVTVEETPLVEDSTTAPDVVVSEKADPVEDSPAAPNPVVAEEADPVTMKETSLVQQNSDETAAGVSEEAEHSINNHGSALVEQSPNVETSLIAPFPGEYENKYLSDHLSTAGHRLQTDSPPAEMEKDSSGPELQKIHSRARTNGADLGKGLSLGGSGGTPVDLMHYNSPKKSEEQVRPKGRWDGSSEIQGCCEPVHWILNQFFGRHIN
jgi:hypothetical protein